MLWRGAGDITVHHQDALHAVTQLVSGVRYGLFVVDASNTLVPAAAAAASDAVTGDELVGGGRDGDSGNGGSSSSSGVIEPTQEMVADFLTRITREDLLAASGTSDTSTASKASGIEHEVA